jgi:hydantoinase/carbamoylase family amidase
MSGASEKDPHGAPAGWHAWLDEAETGARLLDLADDFARISDDADVLTLAYATAAHTRARGWLLDLMRGCGCDEVRVDAVGNVRGHYHAASGPGAKRLLTGSHYDTVRNGGRYDGRLGILAPLLAVEAMATRGERPPFEIVVIAFADEEGLRFGNTFLGSSAVAGCFDTDVLDKTDAAGISLREAMSESGLRPEAIPDAAIDPASIDGFVEIHIEQGPVLLERGLALGVVTAINGAVRLMLDLRGRAAHAGTTPMTMRRDAACAAAEIVLAIEARCRSVPDLVGTAGIVRTEAGSVNTVPGQATVSVDIRAPQDDVRDSAVADVLGAAQEICTRRGVTLQVRPLLKMPATAASPRLSAVWRRALGELQAPAFELPSGAGHDAMCMARCCEQAMLFVRCGNDGISHSPDESLAAEDAGLAVRACLAFFDCHREVFCE